MRITSRITRISAASAVLAGLMLTQQACAGGTPSAAPPPAPQKVSATATSDAPGSVAASGKKPETKKATPKKKATKKAAGDVFSGTREVWVLPVNSEGTLGVSSSRKVELSDAFDDRTLFVLTKVQGERYWIRTARVRAGGEALCLQVEKDSRVTAAACDAAKSTQLFLFRNTGTSNGKLKYTIRTNNNVYIIVTPEGGVRAVPIGEGTPDIDTPFLLPDRGEAHLPDLD